MRISDWSSDVCSSDLIVASRQRDNAPIEDAPLPDQLGPGDKQWFDRRHDLRVIANPHADLGLKTTPAQRQSDSITPEKSSHDVLDPDELILERVAGGEQGTNRKSTRLNSSH